MKTESKLQKIKFLLKVFSYSQCVQNNRLSKAKKAWNKFTSSTTFHGFPKVASADNLQVKLLWIILISLSFSGGMINIFETVNDFYKYDVITNIERVTAKNPTFPAITICSTLYINVETKQYNSSSRAYYTGRNFTLKRFLRDPIKFKGEAVALSEIEFFSIPYNYFGNCLRFNGFKDKDLAVVDLVNDVLELQILKSIVTNISANESIVETLIEDSFAVYVTDNYINSYLRDGVTITRGGFLKTAKVEVETKLAQPYNDCTQSKDKTYRHMNCIEECVSKQIKDTYNCTIRSYYKIDGLEECGLLMHEVYKKDLFTFHICESECPKECESVIYSSMISNDDFNGQFWVYLSEFSWLNITQIPKMNEFSFISNIGGSLGLFVGISFLS